MAYFALVFQKDHFRSSTTWGGLGETRKAFSWDFYIFILLRLSTRPNSKRDGDWENGQQQMRVLFQDLSSGKEPGSTHGVLKSHLPLTQKICSASTAAPWRSPVKSHEVWLVTLSVETRPSRITEFFFLCALLFSPRFLLEPDLLLSSHITIPLKAGTLKPLCQESEPHQLLYKQTWISLSRQAQISNNGQIGITPLEQNVDLAKKWKK